MPIAMPIDSNSPILPARAVILGGKESTTVTATVVTIDRREENGIFGRMVGLDAHLQVLLPGDEQPYSYFMSRLVNEPCWLADALLGPTSFPHFSHGFGARYLKKQGVAPELEALLDEAARSRGLVSELAPGIPLVLTDPDSVDAAGTPARDRSRKEI